MRKDIWTTLLLWAMAGVMELSYFFERILPKEKLADEEKANVLRGCQNDISSHGSSETMI